MQAVTVGAQGLGDFGGPMKIQSILRYHECGIRWLDEVIFAAEREFTTLSLERESRLLRNVRAAMGRIAEGAYGTCLECDEEISQKRLRAVPWATLCIACQEQSDQDLQRRFAPQQRFLAEAA